MFEISREDLQQDVILAMSNQTIEKNDRQVKLQKLQQALKTDFENGLTGEDLKERQAHFGENKKNLVKPSWRIALIQTFSVNITIQAQIVLSFFALVYYIINTDWPQWIESIVIQALLIYDLLSRFKQVKQEREMDYNNELIKEQNESSVIVIRNGAKIEILSNELCVGDIVIIRMGDKIPADGLIIAQEDLSIDESPLTGESEPTKKVSGMDEVLGDSINLNSLYALKGTLVMSGEGKILILAVGESAFQAKISQVYKKEEKNGLKQALTTIKLKQNFIFFIEAFFIVLVLLIKIITHDRNQLNFSYLRSTADIINIVIILGSCTCQQQIFLHLTITLATSVKKLLKDCNLVRKLESIENLAYMDQMLLDQQSLTENELTVVGFWNDKFSPIIRNQPLDLSLSPQLKEYLEQTMFLNSNVRNEYESGSASDKALFKLSQKWNYNFKEVEESKDFTIIRIPFTSMRKRNTAIINNQRVVVRGSLELILTFSTKYLSYSGGLCDLSEEIKEQILQQQNQAHRNIGLAYRDLNGDDNCQELIDNGTFDLDQKQLVFIGFLSLTCPIKFGTRSVIAQFKNAGIGIKMITGNHIALAQDVAQECGIYTKDSICQNGHDFIQEVQNRNYEIEKLAVLGRSTPEVRLTLLTELQKRGHIVGVYGDGTNDAPALNKSDVGICGGISSTEIARECSGIILLDDNIRSILSGIIFGRNLIESLKQYLQYSIITMNSLLLIQILYSIKNNQVFSILQFLWINLIIDISASIVIVQSSQITSKLLQRKPNIKGELKLNNITIVNILVLIIYTSISTVLISNSMVHSFNTFIIITIFNMVNSTKLNLEINIFKGLFQSWIAGSILLGIIVTQYILIEFGGVIMKTTGGLTIQEWILSFLVGLGSIIVRGLVIIVIRCLISSFKVAKGSKDVKEKIE